MKAKEQSQLPDNLRQLVHRFSVTHRTTGLSPPEETIYLSLEAEEDTEEKKEYDD